MYAAKARGACFDRPIKKPSENFGVLVAQWEQRELALLALLEQIGLKTAIFYRRLREFRVEMRKPQLSKCIPFDSEKR